MYNNFFYITGNISNNAFGFSLRKNPKIYVPSLIEGSLDDVTIGENIVFEEFNEENTLISCKGLKNFVKILGNQLFQIKAPIYIFDNHNHAFAFWHWELLAKNLKSSCVLVHIDQHKDNREPASYLTPDEAQNPQNIFNYTNTELNVGNFIPPAIKTGLINEVIIIDSEYSLNNYIYQEKEKDLILDIDLDFFSKDMDYIDNQKKVTFIKNLLPKAKVITFATSPFFIEQEKAIYWLKKILE